MVFCLQFVQEINQQAVDQGLENRTAMLEYWIFTYLTGWFLLTSNAAWFKIVKIYEYMFIYLNKKECSYDRRNLRGFISRTV